MLDPISLSVVTLTSALAFAVKPITKALLEALRARLLGRESKVVIRSHDQTIKVMPKSAFENIKTQDLEKLVAELEKQRADSQAEPSDPEAKK
ncbi:hypothetical protein [Paraburkholderia sp. J8-2]|uniref:hypothetical protein n=1 Tax=Paraburkholderia sp. J8-2 TaxID=2805440 RepID=UPI002AB75B4E|nr:hypothetical protein [Paraburkholderia sp. J8-2]